MPIHLGRGEGQIAKVAAEPGPGLAVSCTQAGIVGFAGSDHVFNVRLGGRCEARTRVGPVQRAEFTHDVALDRLRIGGREAHPWAKDVPQSVWRGGVFRAHEQIARWEAANDAHGRAVVRALEDDREIPRRVQRRNPDPKKLYRRRKRRDRSRSNSCLIAEKVKRIDEHTLWIGGVGKVPVREKLPKDFKPRSCTIVERTSVDVSGCVEPRINGEQRSPLAVILGAGGDSERWVGV